MSAKRTRDSRAPSFSDVMEPRAKRGRHIVKQPNTIHEVTPRSTPDNQPRAEQFGTKNDDVIVETHNSVTTLVDDDELSMTSSDNSIEEENVFLDWFQQASTNSLLKPKQVLREQRIKENQLTNIPKNHVAASPPNSLFCLHLTQTKPDLSSKFQAHPTLHHSISVLPPPRQRQAHVHTVEHAVSLIRNAKKIMVLTGAGISVSCGIPDFRSADGLYKMIDCKFDLPDPQALFDVRFFADDPAPFFQFAKNIFPGTFSPSLGHRFIKTLQDKGKLLRNYTQNIDTLEQMAGITNCLECHGSFRTASCFACKHQVPCEYIRKEIMNQEIPRCTKCSHEDNVMKPDIVFFGEGLPPKFGSQLLDDLQVVDLLIVIGSSLRVRPVCTVPSRLSPHIPQILINRERVGRPHQFDVELLGNCDTIVAHLLTKLGWSIPGFESKELAQTALQEPHQLPPNTHIFEGGIRPPNPYSSSYSFSSNDGEAASDRDPDNNELELLKKNSNASDEEDGDGEFDDSDDFDDCGYDSDNGDGSDLDGNDLVQLRML